MHQHCKYLLYASGFVVFSLHVSRVFPLLLFASCLSDAICTSSACTTQAYVKTAAYQAAFAMNPYTIRLPIALHQQTVTTCKYECYASSASNRTVSPLIHWLQILSSAHPFLSEDDCKVIISHWPQKGNLFSLNFLQLEFRCVLGKFWLTEWLIFSAFFVLCILVFLKQP